MKLLKRTKSEKKTEVAARVYPSRHCRCHLPPPSPPSNFDGSPPPLTAALAVGGGGDLGPALGAVTRSLMLGFGFGLHDGIGVVVATMASWNKVSLASPYLVNISGID